MQVCIVVNREGRDIPVAGLHRTLRCVEEKGIEGFTLVKSLPKTFVEDVLYLYPGEMFDNKPINNQRLSEISINNIICFHQLRSSKGYKIEASKATPTTDFVKLLMVDTESSRNELKRRYPDHLETHFRIATQYYQMREFKKAFTHFQIALSLKGRLKPEMGYIPIYHQYLCQFEASLCAYYAGEFGKGRLINDRILVNPSVPNNFLARAYNNYEYYIMPLECIWRKEYVVDDMESVPEDIKGWKSLNPSLLPVSLDTIPNEGSFKNFASYSDRFFLNIRVVNWRVNPVGFNQYSSPHPKGKFKTKNLLAMIDEKGMYLQQPKLIDNSKLEIKKLRKDHIDGFEDCRLYDFDADKNILRFIGNYTKNNPKGRMRLSLGKISLNDEIPSYVSLTPIIGYDEHLTQKNWLCYHSSPKELNAIYGYDPFTIIQIDESTGIATAISQSKLPIRASEFRGSAGPVPFNDGYLLIIHQVYFKSHGGRRYLHRFIKLDKNHLPEAMSYAWYLQSKDIEYVSTMQLTSDGNYLIGYGLCDRCACISCVSKDVIDSMLRPIYP
jgi:hypothetical protein